MNAAISNYRQSYKTRKHTKLQTTRPGTIQIASKKPIKLNMSVFFDYKLLRLCEIHVSETQKEAQESNRKERKE